MPLRDDPAKIPIVEAEVQDKFVGALYKKLMLVESKLPHVRQATDSMLQLIIFLARMLQFSLGLGRPWSDQLKESGSELMACLVRLSAVRPLADLSQCSNALCRHVRAGFLRTSARSRFCWTPYPSWSTVRVLQRSGLPAQLTLEQTSLKTRRRRRPTCFETYPTCN